jgi:hypothetical protein
MDVLEVLSMAPIMSSMGSSHILQTNADRAYFGVSGSRRLIRISCFNLDTLLLIVGYDGQVNQTYKNGVALKAALSTLNDGSGRPVSENRQTSLRHGNNGLSEQRQCTI